MRFNFVGLALLFMCALLWAGPGRAQDGPDLAERLGRLPGALLKAKKTDAEIVDALFVATLARLPKEAERSAGVQHLGRNADRANACRDLLWAVINTKEFLHLHGFANNLDEGRKFAEKITRVADKR